MATGLVVDLKIHHELVDGLLDVLRHLPILELDGTASAEPVVGLGLPDLPDLIVQDHAIREEQEPLCTGVQWHGVGPGQVLDAAVGHTLNEVIRLQWFWRMSR